MPGEPKDCRDIRVSLRPTRPVRLRSLVGPGGGPESPPGRWVTIRVDRHADRGEVLRAVEAELASLDAQLGLPEPREGRHETFEQGPARDRAAVFLHRLKLVVQSRWRQIQGAQTMSERARSLLEALQDAGWRVEQPRVREAVKAVVCHRRFRKPTRMAAALAEQLSGVSERTWHDKVAGRRR